MSHRSEDEERDDELRISGDPKEMRPASVYWTNQKERAVSRRELEQATAEAVLDLLDHLYVGSSHRALLQEALTRYRRCRGIEE
jgi:hypothetical protein